MIPTLSAAALVMAGLGRSASGTSTCAPSAVVEGPPAVVRSVSAILRAHGVGPGPSSCAREDVRATLSSKGGGTQAAGLGGYVLRLEDRFGRSNERDVRTPEAAASLIESWVVGEDSDLVAPRAAIAVTDTAPPPASAREAGPWLAASGEISSTTDGLTWYGVGAIGCTPISLLCVGGRALYAHATGPFDQILGAQITGAELSRDTAGGVVLAALPLRYRSVAVSPMVGLGAAWMRTEGALASLSASANDTVVLADGALVAEVSIGGGWSVFGELGATWERQLSSGDREGTAAYLPLPPSRLVRAGLGIGFSP